MVEGLGLFDAVVLMCVGAIAGQALLLAATSRSNLLRSTMVGTVTVFVALILAGIGAKEYFRSIPGFWSAAAAAAGALSALIASVALIVAALGVKAARDADANTAARVKDRETRDAKALAMAFQQEVHRVWMVCKHLEELSKTPPMDLQFLLDMHSDRGKFDLTAMGQNLSHLGAFPPGMGLTIAKCYSASRSLYEIASLQESYIKTNHEKVSNGWSRAASKGRRMFAATYNLLCAYTGEGKPIE
jgi:hypothetical protein